MSSFEDSREDLSLISRIKRGTYSARMRDSFHDRLSRNLLAICADETRWLNRRSEENTPLLYIKFRAYEKDF